MRKRMILCLLAAVLSLNLLSVGAIAAGMEVTVSTPETLPAVGQTFKVEVSLSGNSGMAGFQMTLQSDSTVVKCVRVSEGEALRGMMTLANPEAVDGARIIAANSSNVTGNGKVATLTYQVVSAGDPNFRVSDLQIYNEEGQPLPGTVTKKSTGASGGTNQPADPAKPGQKPVEQPKPETQPEQKPETPSAGVSFPDVKGHLLERYIDTAVEKGFFGGYPDGSFRPGGAVSRGAFVTVLWRAAGKPQATGTTPFTDIGKVSEEFRTAITWAYNQGYIGGRTATTFAPGAPVSRQAAMKILYAFSGGRSGTEIMFTGIYDSSFPDSGTLSAQVKEPMYWAVYHGLVSGTADGRLNGGGTASRAQLAKILTIYDEKFIQG